jgi:methylmalonyl-CoA mutase N-terminal domain/subunit
VDLERTEARGVATQSGVEPRGDAAEAKRAWKEGVADRYAGRDFSHVNRSGVVVEPAYNASDQREGAADALMPGQYPFTRGIYPVHYQYQRWMDLQIIGYGVASQLRERMELLDREGGSQGYFGGSAFNVIFDMPTSMGYDPDYPGVRGSIGEAGVSICKAHDYQVLLEGRDLEKTHFSMVCNAGSPGMLALYLAAARRLGFDPAKLRGNITNYIWDFFGHCGGMNFSPRGSYRLCVDVAAYCAEHAPHFGTITISEHNICEAGATNVQSVGLAIATVIALNEECRLLGVALDDVVPGYGFHLRYGEDLFEDIAKTRALRSLYATVNRERFGCVAPASLKARIHGQTAGSLLTVQQPTNNIVRNAYGALAAVLAGVNGMTINAFDEARGLPTEKAVTLSLRTSQILAEESGVTHVSDPLGGSHYVESLTARIGEEAMKLIADIDERGGLVACIESGWVKGEITAAAYEWRREVETGERPIVGVNKYVVDEIDDTPVFRPDETAQRLALEDLQHHRATRDAQAVDRALEELRSASTAVLEGRQIGSATAALVAAADADATLGEMQAVLLDVFGRNK